MSEWIWVVAAIVGLGGIVWMFLRRQAPSGSPLLQQQVKDLQDRLTQVFDSNNQLLHQQLNSLQSQLSQSLQQQSTVLQTSSNALSTRMDTTTQSLNQRLDAAARVIGEVRGELGKVSDTMKAVSQIQDILKAPKLRGGFGEIFLGDLLEQILPRQYDLQYTFRNGTKVDAVVKLADRMIPIDSKFPLENFNKATHAETEDQKKLARRQFATDMRRHVDAVEKYISPDEGTYEFALMYIPAESIYYEVAVKNEWSTEDRPLLEYALSKKVIPVSPNTLYVYLYTISLGLRGMAVERNTKAIIGQMVRLQKELARFQDEFSIVGKHLHNAATAYDKTDKRLGVLGERMKAVAPQEEVEALPIPATDPEEPAVN